MQLLDRYDLIRLEWDEQLVARSEIYLIDYLTLSPSDNIPNIGQANFSYYVDNKKRLNSMLETSMGLSQQLISRYHVPAVKFKVNICQAHRLYNSTSEVDKSTTLVESKTFLLYLIQILCDAINDTPYMMRNDFFIAAAKITGNTELFEFFTKLRFRLDF